MKGDNKMDDYTMQEFRTAAHTFLAVMDHFMETENKIARSIADSYHWEFYASHTYNRCVEIIEELATIKATSV